MKTRELEVKVTNFAPDEDTITVEVGSDLFVQTDVFVQTYRNEAGEVYVRIWQKNKKDVTYQLGEPTK